MSREKGRKEDEKQYIACATPTSCFSLSFSLLPNFHPSPPPLLLLLLIPLDGKERKEGKKEGESDNNVFTDFIAALFWEKGGGGRH